jgi:hypothetical protein
MSSGSQGRPGARLRIGDWRVIFIETTATIEVRAVAIDAISTNDERAMMGKLQIIHTDGEDLVVIPRSDYEALLACAGDEASEDAMIARIIEANDAKIARGEDVALPTAVWVAIESGEHSIRAIRKYRGLTQIDVADTALVSARRAQ